jgi:hypothetical protein
MPDIVTKVAPSIPKPFRRVRLEDVRPAIGGGTKDGPRYVIGRKMGGPSKPGEFSGMAAFLIDDSYDPPMSRLTGSATLRLSDYGSVIGIEVLSIL